jgi:hypothetical protein
MNPNIQKLAQKLTDLQTQTEEMNGILKNVRIKAHDIFWSLRELKGKNITLPK